MGRLTGKVVTITGAAGGLGRATARMMASEGASLALTDTDEAGLADLVGKLRAGGAGVIAEAGDVAARETHERIVAAALSRFGGLHGWCNVAGILGPGDLPDITPELFDRLMHVNCLSHLLAAQQAAPAIKASGGGAVVNVSSIGGLVALPHMTAYCASKSAVIGLTRGLAVELAPDVRCNVVCPGGIDTGMAQGLLSSVPEAEREELVAKLTGRQLIKRFAQPEEIAPMLLYLVSDESRFITGAILSADGGHSAS